MAQLIVHCRKVEVHLTGIFRFERSRLQIDDDVAAQLEMIKKQVDVKILAIHREMYLLPHKSESRTQLDKELADVRQQTVLQFPLGHLSAKRQEIEVVRVAHDLVRKIGLRRRQCMFE